MDRDFSVIPVNLTEAGTNIILHAPMPGAEPENIVVEIGEDTITLRATPRGELGEHQTPLRHEWRVGDYRRTIQLSYEVDSEKANATYNNGVLTVTLPRGDRTTPREIRLEKLEHSEHGQTQGHAGQQRPLV